MIGEGLNDLTSMETGEIKEIDDNLIDMVDIEKEQPVTTEEELKAFEIVKNILDSNGRDVTNLAYRDNLSYFNVIDRVITNWFLRLYSDREEKNIITRLDVELVRKLCPVFKVENSPKGSGLSRVYFNNIEDLRGMENLIIACFDELKRN
ncbi:hypothetical protein WKH56_06810 [Priestia sp. SB1]|uniref:hypothetical protein n=1 Tax=Priestia sp. SB1 TaxID=3132359 RepID=UPI00317E8E0E